MFKRFQFTRSLAYVALVVVAGVVLTACTSNNNGQNNQNQQITLQWWGVFWDKDVVQPLIDEYQSLHSNVKIEYANRWQGGKWETAAKLYQDNLDRVLKAGNQVEIPDIFMVQNTWVGNYENYAAEAPSSVIDANTVKTAFYPAVAQDFAHNDKVYGLPLWMDALAILYNKTLLASAASSAPPTNWVDFKTLAINLTVRSGGTITRAGFAAGTADNTSFAPEILNLLFLQNGVKMTDASGNPSFSTSADSQVALEFYKSFATGNGSWSTSMSNDAAAFLQGDAAMIVAPSWRYADILAFNKLYNLGLNIGVAPMPQLQGQAVPTINWATYWGNMIALNRPNAEESWKFLKWLTEPDQLKKLHTAEQPKRQFFGFLYPRSDMQQELQADTYLRVYNAALPSAQTWYMVDGYAVRESFKKLIGSSGTSLSDIAQTENEVDTIIKNKGKL
jgi:multiple sugar transport system substrate-binding protein